MPAATDLMSGGANAPRPGQHSPPGASSTALALELAAERARRETVEADLRRARFVADVMSRMVATMDFEQRVADLARAIIPELGDWCAIDVLEEGTTPEAPRYRRLAVEHFSGDPAKVAMAREMEARWPEDPAKPSARTMALRAGAPIWMPEISDEMIAGSARDAEHERMARALGLHSFVVAPLLTDDRPLGVLTLVTAESRRTYNEVDVGLVHDLARRVARLIEVAMLHGQIVAHRARLAEQGEELEQQAVQLQDAMVELEAANETLQDQAVELESTNLHLQEAQLGLEAQAEELSHANDVLARTALDLEAQREAAEAARHVAEEQRAAAQAANRAKADFLAMMSHELRTPLNAIGGYVDLLELEVRGPINAVQREDLGRIRRAKRQLLAIITDILNFARLEQGKIEMHPAPVRVSEALEELSSVMEPLVATRGLAWTCAPVDPSLCVLADPERLNQVLLNLAQNASKFTEAGTIGVSVEPRPDEVAILVTDTGRGIPAQRLATIWEPFVQIDRMRTSETDQGLGLGLPISRELARAMGGDITVESTVGEGSTFTLTLPRAG